MKLGQVGIRLPRGLNGGGLRIDGGLMTDDGNDA